MAISNPPLPKITKMSVQTLYTAATGMEALETKLDVIANNMANINTTGFKKDRANFEDLVLSPDSRCPGAVDADGSRTSTGVEVGLGVRVSSTQTNHDQGAFQTTNNRSTSRSKAMAFSRCRPQRWRSLYTRAGNFDINANDATGARLGQHRLSLDPAINIPQEAIDVVVTADGQVQYRTAGSIGTANGRADSDRHVHQSRRPAETGRQSVSRDRRLGRPPDSAIQATRLGRIRQGVLEASNVEPVTELIDLITTQRAFELNSQVVQAGDQIMQVVANIRR